MKYIILCGGRGERFISATPKPLNRVCGRMIGEWMIKSILKYNITELIWILNPKLYNYNIEEEIIRWTNGIKNDSLKNNGIKDDGIKNNGIKDDGIKDNNKNNKINNIFIKLPFETRDPTESLELALSYLNFDEEFICLDNDNIYVDGLETINNLSKYESFILISKMNNEIKYEPRYGFVKIHDNMIVDGKEKEMGWGENGYSCGGYGFKSLKLCKFWLQQLRKDYKESNNISLERSLLSLIIKYSKHTLAIETKETFSIGTPEDCAYAEKNRNKYFGWQFSKIVVDLDNTLVTYPQISGDYTTVKPKEEVINWIKDKSSKGANITVSTARRMQTHNGNVNAVIADIGATTIETVKSLDIKEKEINFGKPIGDIYIDDRAINPFDSNWIINCGDWSEINYKSPINSLPVTRNVNISVKYLEYVDKTGSYDELNGQAKYYEFLKDTGKAIQHFFPLCYNILYKDDLITLEMENIKGIPASYLWCYNLWGEREWDLCINSLKEIHMISDDMDVNYDDIRCNYIDKVDIRRNKYKTYDKVDNDGYIWKLLKSKILKSKILDYKVMKICCIHGDSFMGNIIFPNKGGIKFIDMRGKINDKITIYGDENYDWGKLITSFLGMDSIVYNLPQRNIEDGLFYIRRFDNYLQLIYIALILMYGAIWAYNDDISKLLYERIIDIINYISAFE